MLGPESEGVRTYLTTMGIDPSRYQPIGADLQFGETVDRDLARRVRLEYATRLKTDVDGLLDPSS